MLIPNTSVWTSKRYKKIKNIIKNDRVLTHNGLFKRVNKVLKKLYIGDIIEVTPYNDKPTTLTPEHKVVCIKRKDNTFGWTEARNLEIDDKLVFPKVKYKKDDIVNYELRKDYIKKKDVFDNDENYYFIPIENIVVLQCNYFLYNLVVEEDRSFVSSMVVLANMI